MTSFLKAYFLVLSCAVAIPAWSIDKSKVRLATAADKVKHLEIYNVGEFTATHQMAVAMRMAPSVEEVEKEMIQESLTFKAHDALEERFEAYLQKTFSKHPGHMETLKKLFAERAQLSWEDKVNLSPRWDHDRLEGSKESAEYDQFVKGPFLVLRVQEGQVSDDSVEGIEWGKVPFKDLFRASIDDALRKQNAIKPGREPAIIEGVTHVEP